MKKNKLCTCVASIKRLADHHPKRIKQLNEKGQLLDYCYHAKEPEPSRRQDFLPHAFIRNGAIYLTKVSYLKKSEQIISDNPLLVETRKSQSVNLDSLEDLEILKRALCK